MTLGGVVILLMISFSNWRAIDGIDERIERRLDKIETQIAQGGGGARAAAAPAARAGLDPNRVYKINTDGAPAKGPSDAPVTIAEFSDFQCPFCSRVNPTLQKIEDVYGDKVRIVWKHLPLAMHKDAPAAHQASMAAHKQGKFWEFHDKLFSDQRNLKLDAFKKHAQDLGMDVAQFEKDMLDLSNKRAVDADVAEARKLGVSGTPGFFVNGRFLRGAKPFEDFAQVINTELARLDVPLPEGARL
jgi:protein-disulfide isomerase